MSLNLGEKRKRKRGKGSKSELLKFGEVDIDWCSND